MDERGAENLPHRSVRRPRRHSVDVWTLLAVAQSAPQYLTHWGFGQFGAAKLDEPQDLIASQILAAVISMIGFCVRAG